MRADERKAAEILSLPGLKAIPPPDLPLRGAAYDKYVEVATLLLRAEKLNMHTKALCEQIGMVHGEIHRNLETRGWTSAKNRDSLERLLKELRIVDNSDAVAPDESEDNKNRFARIGVITRRGAQKAAL